MHLYANILVRPKITEIYHILHTFPITEPKLDRNSKKWLLQKFPIALRILKLSSFFLCSKTVGGEAILVSQNGTFQEKQKTVKKLMFSQYVKQIASIIMQ